MYRRAALPPAWKSFIGEAVGIMGIRYLRHAAWLLLPWCWSVAADGIKDIVFTALATVHALLVLGSLALSGIKTAEDLPQVLGHFGRNVLYTVLWSAYMLKSGRVKATFVNRLVPPSLPVPEPIRLDAAD